MTRIYRTAVSLIATVGTALLANSALAADYPSKPVKIMVGFSAGGGTDTTARGFASYMHEAPSMQGMPGVIVNLPGASGMKAAKVVKDSDADGYTLYMINLGTFAAAEMAAGDSSAVSGRQDFINLGCMTQLVTSLQVHTSDPATSASQWVENAKASGKTIRWATSGASTMHALIGHLFLDTVGIKHQIVPFKGGSKARGALVAQKVDATFNGIHLIPGFTSDIKALGVPSDTRDPANPDTPTFAEQGLPNIGITGPMCLFAPAGTSADAVAALQAAVEHVAGLKGFGRYMKKQSLAAFHLTSEQGDAATTALFDKLGPVVAKVLGK